MAIEVIEKRVISLTTCGCKTQMKQGNQYLCARQNLL